MFKDGAFGTFLKQVERMHAQGKASFEAEYNVRHLKFLARESASILLALSLIFLSTQSIERKTSSSTAAAERNSAKNRYKNILPCECYSYIYMYKEDIV